MASKYEKKLVEKNRIKIQSLIKQPPKQNKKIQEKKTLSRQQSELYAEIWEWGH